jgi:hypothetical protein
MTINRFRVAAGVLIGFNIIGTILTWAAGLQKPGTGLANAIGGGTQFTGPLVLVVIAVVALAATYSARRRLAFVGVLLLALYGVGFSVGEISELFQHNVGIDSGRWDIVLAGAVIGIVVGVPTAILGAATLLAGRRRAARPAPLSPSNR